MRILCIVRIGVRCFTVITGVRGQGADGDVRLGLIHGFAIVPLVGAWPLVGDDRQDQMALGIADDAGLGVTRRASLAARFAGFVASFEVIVAGLPSLEAGAVEPQAKRASQGGRQSEPIEDWLARGGAPSRSSISAERPSERWKSAALF